MCFYFLGRGSKIRNMLFRFVSFFFSFCSFVWVLTFMYFFNKYWWFVVFCVLWLFVVFDVFKFKIMFYLCGYIVMVGEEFKYSLTVKFFFFKFLYFYWSVGVIFIIGYVISFRKFLLLIVIKIYYLLFLNLVKEGFFF